MDAGTKLQIKKWFPKTLKVRHIILLGRGRVSGWQNLALVSTIQWSMATTGYIFLSKHTHIVAKPENFVFQTPDSSLFLGLDHSGIIPDVRIECAENARITVDGHARLLRGVHLSLGNSAQFSIGDQSYVHESSKIFLREGLKIGGNCAISWNVTFLDSDNHALIVNDIPQATYTKAIEVEDHVWIGCGATILKGVKIGRNSVVAAGAVVTKNVPANCLVAGCPAKVIKENVNWKI